MVGESEVAPNRGRIVQWSIQGLGGKEGQRWCAFFACQAVQQELLARGDLAGVSNWRRISSGSCATLWARLAALGFTVQSPALGDFVFFGGRAAELHHVGLVQRYSAEQAMVYTVEGNSGDAVREHHYPLGYPGIFGYQRLPW